MPHAITSSLTAHHWVNLLLFMQDDSGDEADGDDDEGGDDGSSDDGEVG